VARRGADPFGADAQHPVQPRPHDPAQDAQPEAYVDAIDRHTIVFGIGPAGTGKTYLAVAKAVQALQAKQVNRIVLTRPAVEAGERLGFLPGTLTRRSTRTCARCTTRCTT
jgi:phosphate starvation-inducible protein PhoH and related proteins